MDSVAGAVGIIMLVVLGLASFYVRRLTWQESGLPFLASLLSAVIKGEPVSMRRPQPAAWQALPLTPEQSEAMHHQTASALAASRAMQHAGRSAYDSLRLEDVGFILWDKRDNNPSGAISRAAQLPRDITHIRPFAAVFIPHIPNTTNGQADSLTLSICDPDGHLRYSVPIPEPLPMGRTQVVPHPWLPVLNLMTDGQWQLEVRLGATLLGIHKFDWGNNALRNRDLFDGDGELTDASLLAVDPPNPNDPVSLEELLIDKASH